MLIINNKNNKKVSGSVSVCHSFGKCSSWWESHILCLFYSQSKNPEKTQEFFQKQALELQGQPEWRDWFALPFIPVPEQNPTFSPYFSRQWADTFLVSLHNFLSVLFQCMHIQTLLLPGTVTSAYYGMGEL